MFANALLIGAFAALAAAQSSVLTFTNVPNPITDGQPQTITFATNDTTSPVTILLRQGDSYNLQTVETLTTSATGGQFVWTPSSSLPNGTNYALEILQGTQINYFGPFQIQGASASGSNLGGYSSAATTSVAPSTPAAIIPGYGTPNATYYPSSNGSLTTTAPASLGTGISIARNATLSSATLKATTSNVVTLTSTVAATSGVTSAASPSGSSTVGGAGSGSQTGAGAAATTTRSTGAASSMSTSWSALIFTFGVVAAVLVLA